MYSDIYFKDIDFSQDFESYLNYYEIQHEINVPIISDRDSYLENLVCLNCGDIIGIGSIFYKTGYSDNRVNVICFFGKTIIDRNGKKVTMILVNLSKEFIIANDFIFKDVTREIIRDNKIKKLCLNHQNL